MATLKRCDACKDVWDPEDYKGLYPDQGTDTNLCSVSVIAPRDPNHYGRDKHSEMYETCQNCARQVIALLNPEAT